MIIRDKQDLRKCVKQSVRRACIVETSADLGILCGEYGIAARIGEWTEIHGSLQDAFDTLCGGSPFAQKPASLMAALDALNLPVHDLDKAEAIISGYNRQDYLASALQAMRAQKVLVKLPIGDEWPEDCDERLAPLAVVDESLFVPGRYGVDYADAAQRIGHALAQSGAQDVLLETFDADALRYCLAPLCEDTGARLHLYAENSGELKTAAEILGKRNLCAVVGTAKELEPLLIGYASTCPCIKAQLQDIRSIPIALDKLGLRFIPYVSRAKSIEEMLGGWLRAKEVIWQALFDAYLPLARTGYELTRERIEEDVQTLLCGSMNEQ